MNRFRQLFSHGVKRCRIIGMVHVDALPGTPLYAGNVQGVISKACRETEVYLKAGIDSILIENMHDVPYVQAKHLGPEVVAMMTQICSEIRTIAGNEIPLGIQILAGGNKEAIAVAQATKLNYIRAEGFVFGHVADEGYTDACAGELLRYRRQINAEDVAIFADIKKKHSSHSITSDVSLCETALAAEFFLADGVILTGTSTGSPAIPEELNELKSVCNVPVIIGSGVTERNFDNYAKADACIIGSYFKKDGDWKNAIDMTRLESLMAKVKLGKVE